MEEVKEPASEDVQKQEQPTEKPETKKEKQADSAGKEKKTKALVLQEIGNKILKANPALNTVYLTDDGTAFSSENDAENHAKELKTKNVVAVKQGNL